MKKFVMGFLIGLLVFAGITAAAADPIKQYILTKAGYSIVVDGVEYNDPTRPILNYEGSTYVPLAKLGDITGVKYSWNDKKKQVEITTSSETDSKPAPDLPRPTPTNKPLDTSNLPVMPRGLGDSEGKTVLYAFIGDEFMGIYSDDDYGGSEVEKILNPNGKPSPLIANGWLGDLTLFQIYNAFFDRFDTDIVLRDSPYLKGKDPIRFPIPEGFKEKNGEDIVSNGVRIKNFEGSYYLNIADLQKVGILG